MVIMKGDVIISTSKVFKTEKKRNFVVVDANYLKNEKLSLKAKGLLTVVLSLPEKWNFSESGLISICSESKTAVIGTLKELEMNGYFQKVRCRNEKGHFFYNYYFFENNKMNAKYNQNPLPEYPPMERL